MGRKNIISVLEKLIRQTHFHCEWQIKWLEEYSAVAVHLQLPLKNAQHLVLQNTKGQQSSSEDILYELRVLFYDSQLFTIDTTSFLQTIPVDQSIGIEYGELLVIVRYLKRIINKTPLYFEAFLNAEEGDVFRTKWQEEDYQLLKGRIIDQHRYSEERVFLPN